MDTTLATAWLALANNPDDRRRLNRLVDILDRHLRRIVPDGCRNGVLRHRENEIRQDALILACTKFLLGNKRLHELTKRGGAEKIENQIRRSLNAAVNATTRKLAARFTRDAKRQSSHEAIDETVGIDDHPARQSTWQWPAAARRRLVVAALIAAVKDGALRKETADLARQMIEGGMSQQQVAASRGVSRQAINQQLQPVRKILPRYVERQEFPTP